MERLDKVLSNLGYGTRKELKKICRSGLVEVNGEIAKDSGMQVDPEKDKIIINGEEIFYRKFIYLMMNKPEGVVSATYDNRDETVVDLLEIDHQVFEPFPVGRLDKDTTGCLLLTNDGPLAHRLLSPKYHVDKVYEAEIDKEMTNFEIVQSSFKKGIPLDDEITLPAHLIKIDATHFELTLHQGKFHQVKRMFEYFGYKVVNLNRKKFAFLDCSSLKEGEYRLLTIEEEKLLRSL